MTKKLKYIIIAGVAVLVLTGLLLLLIFLPTGESGQESATGDAAYTDHAEDHIDNEDNSLLIDRQSDELSHLVLTNSHGTFTMRRSASTGQIVIDQLADVPINDEFAEFVWYGSLTMGWNYKVGDGTTPSDLSAYGLDSPRAVCKAYYNDGTTTGFSVGAQVPASESGLYYMLVDGFEGVYVIYIDESFFQGSSYWISDDVFSVGSMNSSDAVDIGKITITGKSFSQAVVLSPVTTQDVSHPFYGYDYTVSCGNKTFSADDYNMSLLSDELSYLTASEAEVYKPTAQQLSEYGIADPWAVVRFERSGREYIIRCGNKTADAMYFKLDGIDVIYSISAASYPMLTSLSADVLRSGELHVRQFKAVSGIKVACAQGTWSFSMQRKAMETDPSLYEYFAYKDGAQIELNLFKEVLGQFNNADIASLDESADRTAPYLTVTISYYPEFGRAAETFQYYTTEYRRYLCVKDGQPMACVTSLWMDKLIQTAQAAE
ncbi:MAG: DUF4340 domain-containing protein [Clostridia bacterium]|nr:DUF4340 domain-containing protein [Clostridia bacterium]